MSLYDYSGDGQDPKVIQKVLGKLREILPPDERIDYVAIQKKPGLNMFPDAIVLASQHVYLCEQTKMGLDIMVETLPWESLHPIELVPENQSYTIRVNPKYLDTIFILEYIPFQQGEKIRAILERRAQQSKMASPAPEPNLPPLPAKIKKETVVELEVVLPDPDPESIPLASIQPEPQADPRISRLESLYYRQLITKQEFEDRKQTYST